MDSHRYQSRGDVEQLWAWLPESCPGLTQSTWQLGDPGAQLPAGAGGTEHGGGELPPRSSQGHFLLLCNESVRQAAESPGVLQHSRAAYACWSSGGQARTISPMGRGHSPNTQHRVISYTPISLLSPLVRSCPRAMGAQAPPTAAAGQVTFLPRSHSCRAGELCTFDFQLNRALQRGSSECFVGSALCPPSCCKPFPSPQQARPRAPAQGCPSPANRELCRFPGLVPSLPSRGEKV